MPTIHTDIILDVVDRLLDQPYPQICRHLVAHDLLAILAEAAGLEIPDDLMMAVTAAKDGKARELLAEYRTSQNPVLPAP